MHRCMSGAITSHVRDRMKGGESHVHILSDLVHEMEKQSTVNENYSKSDIEKDTENPTHMAEFDRLMTDHSNEDMENDESNFYSAQIANYMESESPVNDTLISDFRPGAQY